MVYLFVCQTHRDHIYLTVSPNVSIIYFHYIYSVEPKRSSYEENSRNRFAWIISVIVQFV